MKKIISAIFAVMGFAILFSACGGETYADKLKKETKAINRFLDENNINVLRTYPDKHKFAENDYYLEPTSGIYIHVVDSGGKDKPTTNPKTNVYLRYDTIYSLLDNSIVGYPNLNSAVPMTFEYGNPSTYIATNNSSQEYYYLSQGCVIPLELGLGRNAVVKLIIPFSNGSYYQQSSYVPCYYTMLHYDFILDKPNEN